MCGVSYTKCLLIWVAKLETSHVLQGNKNKTYRGRYDRLSVSILSFPFHTRPSYKNHTPLQHGALQWKEMSNWISPTVKQQWNYSIHILHKFFGFNINATVFCLGRSSLHLLLLKSSMTAVFKMSSRVPSHESMLNKGFVSN